MTEKQTYFVVPTYRLREVGETIEQYDEHFSRNGYSIPLIIFDDSSTASFDKYYSILEQTHTHNPLYYVGPKEKEQFIQYLDQRLGNKKLTGLVKNLFRPSYGGNRNFTLMYTLGGLIISSDDDMRPYTYLEDKPESLEEGEVCRGRLHKVSPNLNGYVRKSFDILSAFLDVLGKRADEVPSNYERGKLLNDTAMELESNRSKGVSLENTLYLEPGQVEDDSIVKMAQTFRSGTNDIDAIDYIELFLNDSKQTDMDKINDIYVLVNFRPVVTRENWRMDCGVAGYDNTFGLPPFFPTRLRFEDYIYRLWIKQPGLVSAHVDAAQNHIKSNYMRNPLAADVFNEEVSNLLKHKIKDSLSKVDELSIGFDYEGEVTGEDADIILTKITQLHKRVIESSNEKEATPERSNALKMFAANLEKSFYSFEPDFFQQNLQRIVDDVITQFKGSLELWPTLVEICYLQGKRKGLPITRVNNNKL
jgi:hypothetical protein